MLYIGGGKSYVDSFIPVSYCKANGGYLQVVNDSVDGPQQYILRCTFDKVIHLIAQNLFKEKRVYINKVVKSIEAKEGSKEVKIKLEDGQELTGKYAVVAMSPHTAGKITYSPPVSEARQIFHNEEMGKTLKAFLVYDEPWWQDQKKPENSYAGYVASLMNANDYHGKDDITVLWCMDNSYNLPMEGVPST